MDIQQNGTGTKKRSANKCREWERERRNRFNEAISQLGELITKSIKENCGESNNGIQNAQFPKIEIIQKAIVFIKEFVEEKSQLKAEILALQVKLEGAVKNNDNKKDASTQIGKNYNTKIKNYKYNKLLMMKKCKHKLLKSDTKSICKSDEKKTNIVASLNNLPLNQHIKQNLPAILPKSIINGKRPSENTFVVLPTPYVLPPRPLLLPAASPAFVLLDALPTNCKPPIPVTTRNGTDVTKTTMVNIVPISAYSHPLSLIKNKKSTTKTKVDTHKKKVKIPKLQNKCKGKDIIHKENNEEVQKSLDKERKTNKDNSQQISQTSNETAAKPIEADKINLNLSEKSITIVSITPNTKDSNHKLPTEIVPKDILLKNDTIKQQAHHDISEKDQSSKSKHNISSTVQTLSRPEDHKTALDKEISDKQDKLPPILETNLCENTVDGGNARLELAEEFLAASPTAAFLMSFPLVSGNRADSPADDSHSTNQTPSTRYGNQRRNASIETPHPDSFYNKTSQDDLKSSKNNNKLQNLPQTTINKDSLEQKFVNNNIENKQIEVKENTSLPTTSNENSFGNLSTSAMISTTCNLTDPSFTLDFECNLNKSISNHSTTPHVTNNNFFYNKNDPFNTVKNTIYSTSSISSGHDFNSLSLYPCAVEKYSTKNKPEYTNVEDNLMKITSSRLTYDIDLGWPHKSFDFVNCTTSSNTFPKENIFTTVSAPFTTSYNPFNPEFHMSLGTSNKKEMSNKTSSGYTDSITNFYTQPSSFWPDEIPFYGNNNINTNKTLTSKQQTYLSVDQTQLSSNVKQTHSKHCESKAIIEHGSDINKNSSHIGATLQGSEKYSKKSPNKMHINWMTSETRSVPNNSCNSSLIDIKESAKSLYGQSNQELLKKQEHNESNYFPIHVNNLPTQISQEEFHVWPSSRPLGTTEITMEPPPINLPTLVGDLALGPHDKKRSDQLQRGAMPSTDLANNFLSVTQLMNRSESMTSRYQGTNIDGSLKVIPPKQSGIQYTNDNGRKATVSRLDTNFVQPCYVYDDPKTVGFENMTQYTHTKSKTNKSSDKTSKSHKNNYSAEALIRGGTQKIDNNIPPKFIMPTQKYNNFNSTQDSSVAQVSHFPPILDYTDNGYSTQQLGTSLYSSTTNTISNSFYSNFMPTSSNLMSSNYSSGNFSGEFMDYNQTPECNYANQKYEELKMRNNNPPTFAHDKVPSSSYRTNRREPGTKHKMECSKKDSNKKYASKKSKINIEVEDWSDTSHLFWQNRTPTKKPMNLVPDEFTFPNYPSNQVTAQYQTEFFNSHLMPSNVQNMSHNVDRTSFPGTSRANFNLSTIFPEITMKVQ